MRHIVFVIALGSFALGMQPRHTDFSGKWNLMQAKSKNLPPSFKNVKSYSMDVRDTGDSMVVVAGFEGAGQQIVLPPTVYAFDGTERYREDTLRLSKRWIRSSWTTTGQKLIVTSRVIQNQGGERRYTETDIWEKTKRNMLRILVTQQFDAGDSTHSEQRVFRRLAD